MRLSMTTSVFQHRSRIRAAAGQFDAEELVGRVPVAMTRLNQDVRPRNEGDSVLARTGNVFDDVHGSTLSFMRIRRCEQVRSQQRNRAGMEG